MICESCKSQLVDMLDARMDRILEVARAELRFQRAHGDAAIGEREEMDAGSAECFHLMEIKAIIEGRKTCGAYDDYGDPQSIKGPSFS